MEADPFLSTKSETCGLRIPDIDLVLQPGTLGGRFTTIEGLLDQVYEELSDKLFAGDSAAGENKNFETFLSKLKAVSWSIQSAVWIYHKPFFSG